MTEGLLFAAVQPDRVTDLSIAVHNGLNQRAYVGEKARAVVEAVKAVGGLFTASDAIQPWTWDFSTNTSLVYTPLILMICALEQWNVWEDRDGSRTMILYMHYTMLSVYDVGKPHVFHARQHQGHEREPLAYHTNSLSIHRKEIEQLTLDLGL